MSKIKLCLYFLISFIFLYQSVYSQNSGRVYRRSGILNGNQVKTVFGNWGVIGQPRLKGPRGAWIFDSNGYIGDVSPLVGAEVNGEYLRNNTWRDTTFYWVIYCPVDRPATNFDFSSNNVSQTFEPVRDYQRGSTPAISSDKSSWPLEWPDIKDPDNPRYDPDGWAGFWNGIFGKFPNSDLETYFVMDDNADNEFSIPSENANNIRFLPDPDNPNRFGLGLEVKVRALQWQQILAQDNIFWVYEITNNGKFTYPRTVFGMLVGTYVGVTGADDSPNEFDDDWSFFDVAEDLTYTGDFPNDNSRNPFWQGAVGLVGYAFLESPGNRFDGIDNDKDADQAVFPPSAPEFTEDDFVPVTVTNSVAPGPFETNKVVTISTEEFDERGNFLRTVVEFTPNQDTLIVVSMGDTITLISGVTELVEGNVEIVNGNERVNENARDGKDNDLDGLIDENYFLHYRQRRTTSDGRILFDILNPVSYVDFKNSIGSDDFMIDERRDDNIDNDGDWSRNPETGELLFDDEGNLLDDVGTDGIPFSNDPDGTENNGFPDPGEPNFDQTDKDESDQIGLASFEYFTPAGEIGMGDDVEMWNRLRPGFFAVPTTFQNGRPTSGEDGDFVYGSGYFPLIPGQTERLSLALIYGWDLEDMVKKLVTVRKIYNSDYRFPIAPVKPTLTAIAGDDSVVLYWDRAAEKSFDPVLREFDFEGYRIYRSTDPDFNDARVVTNSAGNVVSLKAIEQFDKIDGIAGWYYPPNDIYQTLQGWSFFLGNETGLRHSYIDYDVDNGRTYYYAVVSYDKGVDTSGVIPSECTHKITALNTGEIIVDVNTAQVTPTVAAAGYTKPKTRDRLIQSAGDGFGEIYYNIYDPTALTGHEYNVYFWDTSNDGIDNNKNWNIEDDLGADGIADTNDEGEGDGKPTPGEPNLDLKDPIELESTTTRYAVKDLYQYQEEFVAEDTNKVVLLRQNLVEENIIVQDGLGNIVPDSLYEINHKEGIIWGTYPGALGSGTYLITYQYHPVYFSENMQGTPWTNEVIFDSDIFDGISLEFSNIWSTEGDTSTWNNPAVNYGFQFSFETTQLPNGVILDPVKFPSNYEMRISDHIVDTTSGLYQSIPVPVLQPTPRKFEIFNTTGGYNVEYFHNDADDDLWPSIDERVAFFEKDPDGNFTIFTWQFVLTAPDTGQPHQFQGGEVLSLTAKFPFNKFDLFSFQTEMPELNEVKAKQELDRVRVVPNPYIVAHQFEPPLPPGITSGRGERRIYFTHIPNKSKIHIFTVRGEHLITLEEDNSIFDGTVTWDLKTKENLDIAYGVYFYVVESPVGKKRGKFAVIK